jgi:nitrate reductase delta subunit
MLLGEDRRDPVALAAVENVQGWTRRRFKLASEAAVLVSEVACRLPGCPPLETVVAFWTEDDRRHQFKLYKPLAQVNYDDIGWLIGSPANHDGTAWDCC